MFQNLRSHRFSLFTRESNRSMLITSNRYLLDPMVPHWTSLTLMTVKDDLCKIHVKSHIAVNSTAGREHRKDTIPQVVMNKMTVTQLSLSLATP